MTSEFRLAIAIITRNRAKLVSDLVHQLLGRLEKSNRDVHIFVSDSSENDLTVTALARFADNPKLTFRKASSPFQTAERHLFDLLQHVTGDYVWMLADDDIPSGDAVGLIFDLLDRHAPDLIVINPKMVSYDDPERVVHYRYVSLEHFPELSGKDAIKIKYSELVKRVGFVHLTCLMSSLIVRRDKLTSVDWQKYFSYTPLYTHSMAMLEAFSHSTCIFTTRDIFAYRLGAPDTNNNSAYKQIAKSYGVSWRYFFMTALARFFVDAVHANLIEAEDIAKIEEIHWDGRKLTLVRYIIDRILDQAREDLTKERPDGQMRDGELPYIRKFLEYLPKPMQPFLGEVYLAAELSAILVNSDFDNIQAARKSILAKIERLQKISDALIAYGSLNKTEVISIELYKRVAELLCTIGLQAAGTAVWQNYEKFAHEKRSKFLSPGHVRLGGISM